MLTKFSYAAIIDQLICIFISHFPFQTINIFQAFYQRIRKK